MDPLKIHDAPGGVSSPEVPPARLPDEMLLPSRKFGPIAARRGHSFEVISKGDIVVIMQTSLDATGNMVATFSEQNAASILKLGEEFVRVAHAMAAELAQQGGVQ